jgi:hypothetical protein
MTFPAEVALLFGIKPFFRREKHYYSEGYDFSGGKNGFVREEAVSPAGFPFSPTT